MVDYYTSAASVSALLPTGASYTDNQINAVLAVLQAKIDAYMGATDWFLTEEDVVLTENGTGTSRLIIETDQRPIIDLSSIVVEDAEIGDLADVYYESKSHVLVWAGIFTKGVQNVVITADVGFAAVPGVVAQTMAEACVRILRAGGYGSYLEMRGGAGLVEQVRIEDAVVRFNNNVKTDAVRALGGTGDADLDRVLARYKYRYAIGGFCG